MHKDTHTYIYIYIYIYTDIYIDIHKYIWRGCPHGVMVKALDCRIIVSEFKLQLHYYDDFQRKKPDCHS